MDTIVALATAQGRAGVAIVRVSGPRAAEVCRAVAGQVPDSRKATLATLRDEQGAMIDRGLVLMFDDGRSFTGEPVCEFQVHGSIAISRTLIRTCLAQPGVRAAEPGEFTRRAFLSGQMDLTEVEGLADLIDAETEAQHRQAMRIFDGSTSRKVEAWRDDLVEALAMLEAAMDFAEEELPADLMPLILTPIDRVVADIAAQRAGRNAAESLRDGFEVAIIGKVNAGKSTLLNALAKRDAAITSERAGTTRDVIEVRMDIGGLPVTLIDTAGLRETDDEVERIGIDRGVLRAREADLRIYLKSSPDDEPGGLVEGDIVVLSKADQWDREGISGKTGQGLPWLVNEIERRLVGRVKGSSMFSRERHFDKLERAAHALDEARRNVLSGERGWDFAGEHLRMAIRALDGIIGRVDVEDVLGRIFSSFCIGK